MPVIPTVYIDNQCMCNSEKHNFDKLHRWRLEVSLRCKRTSAACASSTNGSCTLEFLSPWVTKFRNPILCSCLWHGIEQSSLSRWGASMRSQIWSRIRKFQVHLMHISAGFWGPAKRCRSTVGSYCGVLPSPGWTWGSLRSSAARPLPSRRFGESCRRCSQVPELVGHQSKPLSSAPAIPGRFEWQPSMQQGSFPWAVRQGSGATLPCRPCCNGYHRSWHIWFRLVQECDHRSPGRASGWTSCNAKLIKDRELWGHVLPKHIYIYNVYICT